jgi:hypothetical protein
MVDGKDGYDQGEPGLGKRNGQGRKAEEFCAGDKLVVANT